MWEIRKGEINKQPRRGKKEEGYSFKWQIPHWYF